MTNFRLLTCFYMALMTTSLSAQSGSSTGTIAKMDINAGTDTINIYMDANAASNGCSVGGPFAKSFTTSTTPSNPGTAGLKNVNAALISAKMAGKKIEVWYYSCVNNAMGSITTIKFID